MSRVDFVQLSVTYGRRVAVAPVSYRVAEGAWLCLIGPNGAGKSSLLHAIAGLVSHRGWVAVGGEELQTMAAKDRARLVALVPQRPTIPEDISVTDYALLGRTPHIPRFGMETAADREVVARVLERLELQPFAHRLLGQLSGGELQRVLLARALAQESRVLLLDEPTSALDLGHQQQVLHLVDDLRRDYGLTVISTMHDLTLAGAHADALLLLDGGRCVADGPPELVLTEATLGRYYQTPVEVLRASDGTLAVVPLARTART